MRTDSTSPTVVICSIILFRVPAQIHDESIYQDAIPMQGGVSTTFDFQRTGAEISQFSIISRLDFASYQQQTAEDGLN